MISGVLCWIRFPSRSSTQDNESEDLSSNYHPGDTVFITNLKYHRHIFSTHFLSLTKNSFCKKIITTPPYTASKPTTSNQKNKVQNSKDSQAKPVLQLEETKIDQVMEGEGEGEERGKGLSDFELYLQSIKTTSSELLYQGQLIHFSSSIHALFSSSFPTYEETQSLVGSELSVPVILLDWSLDIPIPTPSSSTTNTPANKRQTMYGGGTAGGQKQQVKRELEMNCLRLFACDSNQYGIEITIPMISQYYESRLKHDLQKNKILFIQLGGIMEVDVLHEVIRMQRLDHTKIFPITSHPLQDLLFPPPDITADQEDVRAGTRVEPIQVETSMTSSSTSFITPRVNRKRKQSELLNVVTPASTVSKPFSIPTINNSSISSSSRKRSAPVMSSHEKRKKQRLDSLIEEYTHCVEMFKKRGNLIVWEEELQRYRSLRNSHTHYLSPLLYYIPLISCTRRTIFGRISVIGKVELNPRRSEREGVEMCNVDDTEDENILFQHHLAPIRTEVKEVESNSRSGDDGMTVKEKKAVLCRVVPCRRVERIEENRRIRSWENQSEQIFFCLLPSSLFEEHEALFINQVQSAVVQLLLHSILIPLSFELSDAIEIKGVNLAHGMMEYENAMVSQAIVNIIRLKKIKEVI